LTIDGESGAAAALSVGAFGVNLTGGGSVVLGGNRGRAGHLGLQRVLTNVDNVTLRRRRARRRRIPLVNRADGVNRGPGRRAPRQHREHDPQLRQPCAPRHGGTLRIASSVTSKVGIVFEPKAAAPWLCSRYYLSCSDRTNLQATAGWQLRRGTRVSP
jgi:hypothetical protein